MMTRTKEDFERRSWRFGELIGLFLGQAPTSAIHRRATMELQNFQLRPASTAMFLVRQADTKTKPWPYKPLFDHIVEQMQADGDWTDGDVGNVMTFGMIQVANMVTDHRESKKMVYRERNSWNLVTPKALHQSKRQYLVDRLQVR